MRTANTFSRKDKIQLYRNFHRLTKTTIRKFKIHNGIMCMPLPRVPLHRTCVCWSVYLGKRTISKHINVEWSWVEWPDGKQSRVLFAVVLDVVCIFIDGNDSTHVCTIERIINRFSVYCPEFCSRFHEYDCQSEQRNRVKLMNKGRHRMKEKNRVFIWLMLEFIIGCRHICRTADFGDELTIYGLWIATVVQHQCGKPQKMKMKNWISRQMENEIHVNIGLWDMNGVRWNEFSDKN